MKNTFDLASVYISNFETKIAGLPLDSINTDSLQELNRELDIQPRITFLNDKSYEFFLQNWKKTDKPIIDAITTDEYQQDQRRTYLIFHVALPIKKLLEKK